MDVLLNKVIERPRLAQAPAREAYWIVLDPHRTGMIGGVFFGWLTVAFYALLGLLRWQPMFGPSQLVSAGLAFVVGYAGVGLFVYYLLRIGEREFPLPVAPPKPQKIMRDADGNPIMPEDLAALGMTTIEGLEPDAVSAAEPFAADNLETTSDVS